VKKKALSELCDILIGRTPSRSVSEYWGKGYKWVSISDMKEEVISSTKEEITEEAIKAIRCRKIPKGTLLLSFKLSVGKLAFAGTDLYTNEAIAALNVKDPTILHPKFLYYALKTIKFVGGNQAVMGITLNSKSLAELKIPLPPLDDQIRIAAVLTRAEKLTAKRKESIKALDEFLKSTFLEMFGDPVKNEKGWKKNELGNVSHIQGGLQVTTKRASNPIELPYLRVANVYRDLLDLREIKTIKVTEAEAARVCLEKGDILVVEGHGNPTEIGRSAVWDGSIQNCLHQNHLIRVRVNADYALPVFISYYINSASGRQQMFRAGKTTSGLNTISSKNVKETLVLLPPLPLQTQFAAIVEKVESLKFRYAQSLTELEKLYGSLSQRAFKGELDLSGVRAK
jgi:type I restriction enzyme S subunit